MTLEPSTHLEILDMRNQENQGGFSVGFVNSTKLCPGAEPDGGEDCKHFEKQMGNVCLNTEIDLPHLGCPFELYLQADPDNFLPDQQYL